MIRKTASLLLTVVMLCSGAALAWENAPEEYIIQSAESDFILTFQLPEEAELISGEWITPGFYTGNILFPDGLFLYLSVSGPDETILSSRDDTSAVTWNKASGITEEYIRQKIDMLFMDDYVSYDKDVAVTDYGTCLAVVRFNDKASPYAYVFTVWNDFEIGLSLFSRNSTGSVLPITDEQVSKIVDFVSELWIYSDPDVDNPDHDTGAELIRFVDIVMPTVIQSISYNENLLTVLSPDGESSPTCFLESAEGATGLQSSLTVSAGEDSLGLLVLNLPGNIPGISDIVLNPPDDFHGADDSLTPESMDAPSDCPVPALRSVSVLPGDGWGIVWSDECLQAEWDPSDSARLILTSAPDRTGETGQVILSNGIRTLELYAVLLNDCTPAVYSVILQ